MFGPTGELMYLVEGTVRAALIDTGTGVGDLKAYIDNLTDKPYFVMLTHGHVDHAMGAPAFD
ncbi:MBL fold metallo-hydrolase [Neobacillus sp. NPDC093182]|uniref:MBL fold metallo-hydrolase n=1 Tax=Neobacillus sp. NPDC093182 TaxID=3364297 RepID=UPI00380DD92E